MYRYRDDQKTADIIARSQVKAHGGEALVQTHLGLMERGLGALEGRRRHAGEALPPDVESSDT
jgi:broad specificity phosphatase PhoE